MLQDIAMYLLDIVNNSIRAEAKNIQISFTSFDSKNECNLKIVDDGCGMSEAQLEKVCNPFFTTRTTRKVGLGMSFLHQLATQCNGELSIDSKIGEGTSINLRYQRNHLDAPPLGDVAESLITLIQAKESINYQFVFENDFGQFALNTEEVKQMLEDVNIIEPSILLWLKEYIDEGLLQIRKEKL